jgi:hypothetical protein
LLLKKGNDIEKSTVFDELEDYNKVNKYNYEWFGGYEYETYSDFQSSEAVVITNAKKEHGKCLKFEGLTMFKLMLFFQLVNTFHCTIRKAKERASLIDLA